jgi:predicted  nucleic acid-binding Zn-ribbon protein
MNEQQQELNERIADDERHAATMRKARDYDALMARAEAAEAEATRLRDENAEAWFAFDRQQSRGDRLAARVAELEALAAQGWRPVTEEPIEDEYYLTYDALLPGNEPWIVNYYSRTAPP